MNIKEIEVREAEIRELVNADETNETKLTSEQIEALTTEMESMKTERAAITAKAEKRQALITATLAGQGTVIEEMKEDKPMDENRMNDVTSKEYRTAWLEGMKSYLKEGEQRSINTASIPGAIPQETLNKIIEVVKQNAPLLAKVSLFRVNGAFSLPIEGTTNDAALHTENALITAAADTISQLVLNGYEITKLVRISRKALAMSVDAFEAFIVKKLGEYVGRKVQYYMIKGTGSNQPQGIDYARTWTDDSTAIQFAAATPTAVELNEVVALLPGAYAIGAVWLMNHKTFWGKVQAIRDDSKYPIVKEDNGKYRILGFEVEMDDQVDDGDFFFGNLSEMYANLSESINVIKSEHSGLPYNAVDFLGECVFDSKIATPAAFIKGAAAL